MSVNVNIDAIYINGNPPPSGPTSTMQLLMGITVLLRMEAENPANTAELRVSYCCLQYMRVILQNKKRAPVV